MRAELALSSLTVEGKNAEEMSVEMLYKISMKNKFIVSMTLPPIDENKYVFKTYKVTISVCFCIHSDKLRCT